MFTTIVADPPWHFGQRSCNRSSVGTGAAIAHYPTMTLEQIKALPIGDYAAPQSHCYLWVTNAFLEYSWEILRGWGFKPCAVLTWVKTYDPPMGNGRTPLVEGVRVRMGLGSWYPNATEHILFGVRGNLKLLKKERNVFHSPVVGHSVKPECAYEMIERCSPGPYLELFARRRRPGWSVAGNELPSDVCIPGMELMTVGDD